MFSLELLESAWNPSSLWDINIIYPDLFGPYDFPQHRIIDRSKLWKTNKTKTQFGRKTTSSKNYFKRFLICLLDTSTEWRISYHVWSTDGSLIAWRWGEKNTSVWLITPKTGLMQDQLWARTYWLGRVHEWITPGEVRSVRGQHDVIDLLRLNNAIFCAERQEHADGEEIQTIIYTQLKPNLKSRHRQKKQSLSNILTWKSLCQIFASHSQ